MSSQMLPQFDTVKFTDVWDNAADFATEYKGSGLHVTNSSISDDSAATLYYLLYAKYANNPIANFDINQFKYKVFSIIFEYGPTWEKRLAVQKALRDLTIDDIRLGSKAIYNQAMNPSTEPSTSTLEEITYINQQNTTNYKRGPLEGYSALLELLKKDVTQDFLNRFQKLFKQFARPEKPLLYVTEEEEDEE